MPLIRKDRLGYILEAMEYLEALGETLVVLRRRAGWNQKELAKKARVGPSQLSKYENARQWPDLPVLLRVTGALDTSLGKFFLAVDRALEPTRLGGATIGDRYPANDPGTKHSVSRLKDVASPPPTIEYPPGPEEGYDGGKDG